MLQYVQHATLYAAIPLYQKLVISDKSNVSRRPTEKTSTTMEYSNLSTLLYKFLRLSTWAIANIVLFDTDILTWKYLGPQ